MRLYNSLTATKEKFTLPLNRPVTLYVCGVTPYDTTHIGHAHTFLIFDILVRYLRWHRAEVLYCQNVTDVDDPLFERAQRDGISWQDLSQREIERFVADCAALNIAPPTFFPKASNEINTMIQIIARLIDLNHAYVHNGNVYFNVHSDPHFGALAHMDYAQMLVTANQRGNDPHDPYKRDPLDFVLWQTGKPGDPTWESPWGPGRPGWHIECSAMSTRYLGPQIDIHGGGRDLLFPHHPCEIAQTEPVTNLRPFAQFWMHTGLVWLNGEKMSKSLGNLVFARDAIAEHGATALRWYLLRFPYRDDFSYEPEGVIRAKTQVIQLQAALSATNGSSDVNTALDVTNDQNAFDNALADDLNTPLALTILSHIAGNILTAVAEDRDIREAQTVLSELATVLGFQVNNEH